MSNALAGLAAGVMAVFGASSINDHRMPSVPRGDMKVRATTTASGSVDLACVAAAVAARERSLSTGVGTYTQSVSSAYSTRASALASAYAGSDLATIRAAVKTSWQNFGAALKLAQKSWRTAQQAAWTQFKIATKSCGAGAASVADSTNATAELTGN